MRKYLLVAAMGLAACGSDKKTSNVGGNTVVGDSNAVTNPNDAITPVTSDPTDPNTLTGPQTAYMGRFYAAGGGNQMAWAGSRITAGVKGTNTVSIGLKTTSPYNLGKVFFSVTIDGKPAPTPTIQLDNTQAITTFNVDLPDTNYHTVQWTKISEPAYGLAVFTGVTAGAGGTLTGTPAQSLRHIEFIGDSIVNGYGVMGTPPCDGNSSNSNADLSFATLTAKALAADYTLIAYSGRGLATNLNGTAVATQNTDDVNNANNVMPAMFLNTIPPSSSSPNPVAWDPSLIPASVVVINLGTNDFSWSKNSYVAANPSTACTASTCNPDQTTFVQAYTALLAKVRAAYPNAYIVATTGPMLSDSSPNTATQQHANAKTYITAAVTAANDSKISFYDFGVQDTNSVSCNYHPSLATHQTMATGGTDALGTSLPGLVSHIKGITSWQ